MAIKLLCLLFFAAATINGIICTTTEPVVRNDTQKSKNDFACTQNGVHGLCLEYKDCDKQNEGEGVIDINGVGPYDAAYFSRLVNEFAASTTKKPDPELNCSTHQLFVEQHPGCGWRHPQGLGYRAVRTEDTAKYGEFPWMVAILSMQDVGLTSKSLVNVYRGGGSLIHPKAVVTAAHLVSAPRMYKARAGEWDSQTTEETFPHQDRIVKTVEVHEKFNAKSLINDIAILFLDEPFVLAPNVGVVCLPTPETSSAGPCFASGWGKDKFGKEGRYQTVLKKVEVPLVSREDCQKQLQTTRLGDRFKLGDSFICAGGERGKDSCSRDGGSPLSCPIETQKGRFVQHGIVAWGIGCGDDGIPGVYTDVVGNRQWIDEKITSNGLSVDYYSKY